MLAWVDDSADIVPSFSLWNAHLSTDDAGGDDEDYDRNSLPVCMNFTTTKKLKATELSAEGTKEGVTNPKVYPPNNPA